MMRIQLKAGRRKTQVPRAKVRKIMSRLFAEAGVNAEEGTAVKKPVHKASAHKNSTRKTASRTAA